MIVLNDPMPGRSALIVFGRNPVPGRVKTRLAVTLGDREAAELYSCFLLDTLGNLAADSHQIRVYLDRIPGDPEVDIVPPHLDRFEQKGDSLGVRMANALGETFEAGFERVCIVGSDHPTLPPSRLSDAFRLLEQDPLVLGPSDDGGFYLLGCRELHPRLFEDVAYGRSDVLSVTVARAEEIGLRPTLLDPWYDVDSADDLPRLISDLREGRATCRFTREKLASMGLM